MFVRLKNLTNLILALAASWVLSVHGADARLLGISKIEDYRQVEDTAPVVNSPGAFSFYAFVDLATENSVSLAMLTLPSGESVFLDTGGPRTLNYLDWYDNPFLIELFYPPGEYRMDLLTRNDGQRSVRFRMPQTFFPNAPRLLNWAELQRMQADKPFEVRWEPFAEGTTNDFIYLVIQDFDGNQVFATGEPGLDPNALRGTARSLTLPANTLRRGEGYEALLMFARVTSNDTNAYPGVPAVTTFVRQTVFPIVAAGTPNMDRVKFELSFTYLAYGGDFHSKTTVDPAYPIQFDDCYVARLFVQNEDFVPALSGVSFSSPPGTALTNLAAEYRYEYGEGIYFETRCLDAPTNSLRGFWTIGYNDYPITFNVPDARPTERLVLPLPTVTLDGDILRRLDWFYQDTRGTRLNRAPLFITNQVVELFNAANFVIFSSTNLAASVTSVGVSNRVEWSSVRRVQISYRDNFGNWYGISFDHSPPPGLSIANESLPHGSLATPYNARLIATNGIPPYRWWLDGRLPPGLTLDPATGVISGVPQARGQFNFGIRVDDRDSWEYEQYSITITVNGPPVIFSPPEGGFVDVGDFTYFEVAAEGTQPLRYQWLFNGQPILGQTNEWLLLFDIKGTDAGDYAVRISNALGTIDSAPAPLSVLQPPMIVTQPRSQEVNPGTDVTFSVQVQSSPPIFYLWRRNGEYIENATNATYNIPNAQPRDAGTYSVLILGAEGFIQSDDATLTFQVQSVGFTNRFDNRVQISGASGLGRSGNFGANLESAEPTIADMPGGSSVWVSWTAPASGIATFTTEGSNFDTLLGVFLGDQIGLLRELVTDDDGADFFASKVRFNAQAGQRYEIVVDGVYGSQGEIVLTWSLDTSGVRLPEILRQPVNALVLEGGTATFTLQATNPPPATGELFYQWYYNGVLLPNATNATLAIPNVNDSRLGWYIAAVMNENEFVLSDWVVIEIVTSIEITAATEDKLANVPRPEPGAQGLSGPYPEPLSAGGSVTRGYTGSQVFNTFNSTVEAGEPNHCGVIGGASQWFSYLATANGLLVIDTDGSDFDTILSVYTGSVLDFTTLKQVACDNDGGLDGKDSRVAFQAVAGTLYLVAIDGVRGAKGTVRLNYNLNTPPTLSARRVNEQLQLQLNGPAQGTFTIQSSNNLQDWSTILTTNAPTGKVEWSSRGVGNALYYRALQVN